MDDDDPSAARDAAEVLLCTAFLLAVPTLPERQLAWIRQMAAVQRPATREYIDRNWPKPVREALLGPDLPTAWILLRRVFPGEDAASVPQSCGLLATVRRHQRHGVDGSGRAG